MTSPDLTDPAAQRAGRWTLAALGLVMAMQLALVFTRAVNQDEFYHYSQVQRLVGGTLTEPLQTLYTRAFAWVTQLPGNGIDHIQTIRLFMLGCEAVTLAAILGIASRFASRRAAWLAVLAYAGAGYVLQHGGSFRFDSPAAALLMSAALILLRSRLGPLAVLGIAVLAGAAVVLTIKAVLYAPVFAGIAWLRWTELGRSKAAALRLLAVALTALGAAAAIYSLHASTLGHQANEAARALMGNTGGKMFALGVPPYWKHHLKGMATAPAVTLLAFAFPAVLRRAALPRAEKLALAGLFLPVTTLLFYHNTAPYYFVYMLAPVCAALAVVIDRLPARLTGPRAALVLGGLALAVWASDDRATLCRQRQLVATAEALFPDRPAYFDAWAMLGRFPKANAFLTPVGIALYRQGAFPSMTSALATGPVPLVMAEDDLFQRAMQSGAPAPELLPQDLAALRTGYVNLWGPFWVAGRDFQGAQQFELPVPGRYRLAQGAVRIDGHVLRPGDVIDLPRGTHTAEVPGGQAARLIWAAAGPPPAAPIPAQPWFPDY